MNIATYIPIIILFIIPLITRKRKKDRIKQYLELKEKRKNGDNEMKALAERLIGKDIIVSLLTEESVDGILREVTDNGLVIEAPNGMTKMVNLEFVTKMQEYPKNKKGKRKELFFG